MTVATFTSAAAAAATPGASFVAQGQRHRTGPYAYRHSLHQWASQSASHDDSVCGSDADNAHEYDGARDYYTVGQADESGSWCNYDEADNLANHLPSFDEQATHIRGGSHASASIYPHPHPAWSRLRPRSAVDDGPAQPYLERGVVEHLKGLLEMSDPDIRELLRYA